MATTASDQINRALRLVGVLAEGETPSAETSQDALIALNQMIDSWSTESCLSTTLRIRSSIGHRVRSSAPLDLLATSWATVQ